MHMWKKPGGEGSPSGNKLIGAFKNDFEIILENWCLVTRLLPFLAWKLVDYLLLIHNFPYKK